MPRSAKLRQAIDDAGNAYGILIRKSELMKLDVPQARDPEDIYVRPNHGHDKHVFPDCGAKVIRASNAWGD